MNAIAKAPWLHTLDEVPPHTVLPTQDSSGPADRVEPTVRASQIKSHWKRRTDRTEDVSRVPARKEVEFAPTLLEDAEATKGTTVQQVTGLVHMFAYEPLSQEIEQFISSREWDGYVTEVFDDMFRGVIYPISFAGDEPEELIEIPMSFVDEDVRADIQEGSIFRLATGQSKRRRQIMHGTKIYFRRAHRLRSVPKVNESLEDLFAD